MIIIAGTGHRTAEAYDRGTGGAPVLHVEYHSSSSGNRAPMAVADTYAANEDASLIVGAPGVLENDRDDDGDSLSAVLASPPDHGTLTLSATGGFSYSPNANFSGTDSFTYHANDGSLNSNTAMVTITISAVNDPPVAIGQTVTTAEDTTTGITLTGSDPDGDTLIFVVLSQPAHGTLSGLGPTVTYSPAGNYSGADSFTFKVNDGKLDSGSATVTITVNAVNDTPVAIAQTVTTAEDTATGITLTGSDLDGDTLTFIIISQPAHGTLSGPGPTVTYAPAINYTGPDSFTFKVNDGATDSATASVSITVTAVNDAPVAVNDIYSASEGSTLNVAVPGVLGNDSDSDGEILTAVLVSGPRHGTVALNGDGSFTYTPADGYTGTDSFTYHAGDGTTNSSAATVTIAISLVNHAPVANAQSVTTAEDTAAAITLTGSDPDGDPITYALVSQPAHGTVSGGGPNVIFTPAADFNGTDGFTFKVNDGTIDSASVSVSLMVTSVNDAPMANAQALATAEDTAIAIPLTGSDVENSPLIYAVVTGPAHGTLGGTAPSVVYAPAANYYGPDSFTFTVSDGALSSGPATVSITVSPVNDIPVANAQAVMASEDIAIGIVLTGSDVENSPLTYTVVSQPAHGTVDGSSPNVIFTPAANYNGSDSFTFRVNDGTLDSPPAAVSITISPVNDVPVADPQSVTTAVNIPVAITLTGSDADGDMLNYFIVTPPAHGTLSGAAPSLAYTPYAAYSGTDSLTFQINDGSLASGIATVAITVQPSSNQAPVVSAGPDKTIPLSTSVLLDGSVSDDLLPNGMLTITWSKVSGPGTVRFTPTNEATASATFSKAGGYTLRLTASDGALASSDDVVVTVKKK